MPLPLVPLIGAGIGLLGGLLKGGQRKKANRELDKLLKQDPTYSKSPFAASQLGLANQYLNARMAGAPQMEQNILASQGNANSAISKYSTDASQALSAAAGAQGQADQSFSDLGVMEAQNKYNMLENLNRAYGVNIAEDDKVYADKVRKFGVLADIKGAKIQNNAGKLDDIFGGVMGGLNTGLYASSVFGMNPFARRNGTAGLGATIGRLTG